MTEQSPDEGVNIRAVEAMAASLNLQWGPRTLAAQAKLAVHRALVDYVWQARATGGAALPDAQVYRGAIEAMAAVAPDATWSPRTIDDLAASSAYRAMVDSVWREPRDSTRIAQVV